MKPVNVLYLIRSWAFGGSHSILLSLWEHLPRDRFNIICVPYDSHCGGDKAFIEQARARGLEVAPDRVPWKSRGNWWRARKTISALIDKYDIDLVHTHDPQSNTIVGIARRRWPCAVVASPYGWWDGLRPFRRFVYQWIERDFALPHFDRVITVSNHMKGRILKGPTPPDRIRVIYTGLELSNPPPMQQDLRAIHGIPEDAFVVGTVSRVSEEKGHRHLIDALAFDQASDAHVLVIGDGPERATLEAQVAQSGLNDRVHLAGWVQNLSDAHRAMDLFAQPSVQQEGLPTAILEAEAAGLPILASDIGGTSETIEVGETGLLVPPANAHALAEAIETLSADRERCKRMGEAARRHIETHFTLDRMIDEVCAVYDQALAAYKPKGSRHAGGH